MGACLLSVVMLILVVGMPRVGSMWTYNVVRNLVQEAGQVPQPATMPTDVRGLNQVLQKGLSVSDMSDPVHVLKLHQKVEPVPPEARVITNVRDIRAVVLSFMRFMRCEFEHAVNSISNMSGLTDYYADLGKTHPHTLVIRYEQMVADELDTIRAINDLLGYETSDTGMQRIRDELVRDKVASRLSKLAQVQVDEQGRVVKNEFGAPVQSVRNIDGSWRVHDDTTGFQTNHITSQKHEEWREVFTPEQQRVLNDTFGAWLERYGY